MATILINAAGGNWSSGATWVGGAAPGASSDVNIAALTGTLTIDGTSGAPNLCRSFASTGAIGTLSHASAKQLNIGDGTTGNFTLVAGLTYAPNASSVLKFVSTTTGNQITCGGKNLGAVIFDGVGGAWQLQDAWAANGSSASVTLTNGSLDTNGQTMTARPLSSSNSNTRSLTLGATSWTLTNGINWDISTSTGMTLSAGSSTISSSLTTGTVNFFGGGLTYGTFSCTTITTTGIISITGANTFGTLTLSCGSGTKTQTAGYSLSANQTVTGTFTSNGNTALLRNFVYSDTLGTPRTITAATVVATHTDFRDITGAGSGSWNFSALTTTANGDAGGNTGLTFTAPKNCYMKTAVSVNWSAGNWYTTSGGSTAITPALPLVHDIAIFDANSVTAGSKIITVDEARIPGFNWTGVLNTPAFAMVACQVYGSAIFVSGMTHTGGVTVMLSGRGSYTLDGGTLTWPASSLIDVNCVTGTYSLARDIIVSTSGVEVDSGTFDLSGFTGSGNGVLTTTATGIVKFSGGTWVGPTGITNSLSMQGGGVIDLGTNTKLTNTNGTLTVSGGGSSGGSFTFGS